MILDSLPTNKIKPLIVATGFIILGMFLAFNNYFFYSLLSYINSILLIIK